jgi:hypothetical protein
MFGDPHCRFSMMRKNVMTTPRFPLHPLYSALMLSVLCALTACGGGNSAATTSTSTAPDLSNQTGSTTTNGGTVVTPTIAVSGRVMNVGYLSQTLVCLDSNDNNGCDSTEPQATTNDQGQYALTVPSGVRGTHLLAVVRPTSHDLGYTQTSTGSNPIVQGWLLVNPLEYDAGATHVTANISLLTTTYHMRLMSAGRNRITNKNAVLLRAGKTDDYSQAIDFDYVASPVEGLTTRLQALTDYLSTRAQTAATPAPMIDTAAVLSAWYNTYNATTNPQMNVSKFDATTPTTIATNLDTYGYRYFHTKVNAIHELQGLVTDNAGFVRENDHIASFTTQGNQVFNGSFLQSFEVWKNGQWTTTAYPEGEYLTFDSSGALKEVEPTDYLKSRQILSAEGNLMSFKMPVNDVRYSLQMANDTFTNWHISDWYGVQLNQSTYAPTTPVTTAPTTCGTLSAKDITADLWFSACRKYVYTQYETELGGTKAVQNPLAKAEYYDMTFLDTLLKFPLAHPLITDCAAANRPLVTVAGEKNCNWVIDANNTHTVQDLLKSEGFALDSWVKLDANGVPRSLKVMLNADGTGTMSGIAATTVTVAATGSTPASVYATADVTPLTEDLIWTTDPKNPNLVLISFKPLVIGQPNRGLVGHFATGDFSVTPSSTTSPTINLRKIALLVQDGAIISGQYYGAGTVVSKRYLNKSAVEVGMSAINSVINRIYHQTDFK